MPDVVKDQKVWVIRPYNKANPIVETTVKSVGPKYITAWNDGRVKYHKDTLREAKGYGLSRFLILDLDEYEVDKQYKVLINKLKKFDWKSLDRDDIDKVIKIVSDY